MQTYLSGSKLNGVRIGFTETKIMKYQLILYIPPVSLRPTPTAAAMLQKPNSLFNHLGDSEEIEIYIVG